MKVKYIDKDGKTKIGDTASIPSSSIVIGRADSDKPKKAADTPKSTVKEGGSGYYKSRKSSTGGTVIDSGTWRPKPGATDPFTGKPLSDMYDTGGKNYTDYLTDHIGFKPKPYSAKDDPQVPMSRINEIVSTASLAPLTPQAPAYAPELYPQYTPPPLPVPDRVPEPPRYEPEPFRFETPMVRIASGQRDVPTAAALERWDAKQKDKYNAEVERYNTELEQLQDYYDRQQRAKDSLLEMYMKQLELQQELEKQKLEREKWEWEKPWLEKQYQYDLNKPYYSPNRGGGGEIEPTPDEIMNDDITGFVNGYYEKKTPEERRAFAQDTLERTLALMRSGVMPRDYGEKLIQKIYSVAPEVRPQGRPNLGTQRTPGTSGGLLIPNPAIR